MKTMIRVMMLMAIGAQANVGLDDFVLEYIKLSETNRQSASLVVTIVVIVGIWKIATDMIKGIIKFILFIIIYAYRLIVQVVWILFDLILMILIKLEKINGDRGTQVRTIVRRMKRRHVKSSGYGVIKAKLISTYNS